MNIENPKLNYFGGLLQYYKNSLSHPRVPPLLGVASHFPPVHARSRYPDFDSVRSDATDYVFLLFLCGSLDLCEELQELDLREVL